MSADDGIYILKTKDQYRVTHAQAIENIYREHDNEYAYYINCKTEHFVPTRVVEYWGDTKYTRSVEVAQRVAETKLRDVGFVEYGIRTFTYNKTWKHIVEDAKKKAVVEIQYLKEHNCSQWKIERLQKILEMDI